jgi:hypothetical protein
MRILALTANDITGLVLAFATLLGVIFNGIQGRSTHNTVKAANGRVEEVAQRVEEVATTVAPPNGTPTPPPPH